MDSSARERSVVIFGAGGHAKVVVDTCLRAGFAPVACLGEASAPALLGIPVEPESRAGYWLELGVTHAIVAIGNNRVRERVGRTIVAQGFELATVVHPFAYVAPSAVLGAGTIVMASAAIQPDVIIGELGIINTGGTVDHDCRLGHVVHVAPNGTLCGTVTTGDRVWVGAGSTVIEGTQIADDVFIAAGAVITCAVTEPACRVGGVPARRMRNERG